MPLSANDVLCAHVASTIRALDDDTEDRFLALPVNIRRPLNLSSAVVGNMLGEIYLSCTTRSICGQLPHAHPSSRSHHSWSACCIQRHRRSTSRRSKQAYGSEPFEWRYMKLLSPVRCTKFRPPPSKDSFAIHPSLS